MLLFIGGNSQGKLNYVSSRFNIKEEDILLSKDFNIEKAYSAKIIYGVHSIIKELIHLEKEPFGIIMEIISKNPEVILISDEIGYGIVPFDKEERFYRELTGRIMCEVAKKANSVERIICGISQKIK